MLFALEERAFTACKDMGRSPSNISSRRHPLPFDVILHVSKKHSDTAKLRASYACLLHSIQDDCDLWVFQSSRLCISKAVLGV